MLASTLASFIHFLAAFGIAAILLTEWVRLPLVRLCAAVWRKAWAEHTHGKSGWTRP